MNVTTYFQNYSAVKASGKLKERKRPDFALCILSGLLHLSSRDNS